MRNFCRIAAVGLCMGQGAMAEKVDYRITPCGDTYRVEAGYQAPTGGYHTVRLRCLPNVEGFIRCVFTLYPPGHGEMATQALTWYWAKGEVKAEGLKSMRIDFFRVVTPHQEGTQLGEEIITFENNFTSVSQ